ncbi:hypothetical protein FQR65_LT07211 [Abscondita terminalis]|nr:hypothetical protein FQR65_LT07211 [Abscondita terminalis]
MASEIAKHNTGIDINSTLDDALTHSLEFGTAHFPICYAYHFKQPLPENETGVPLEHLLSCLSIVDLVNNEENKNIKYVKLKPPNDLNAMSLEDIHHKSISPDFIENVTMFCREMIDLLTNVKNCELLVNCFIPSYYRYFGKQCRVADYGFSRLSDLFEAVSHIVQVNICKIIDSSNRRMITLTHTVQVQRFTVDLLRVINSQRSKTLSIILFPHAYEQTFFKPFNPREYGACSLEDLLCSVEKDKIVFGKVDNVDVMSIRRRVQTVEEIRRTQQFAIEVKNILQNFPYYTMPFNTFLPSYHHYFGRQCKVTDYGFTKLIELFEAIPETVEVEGLFDMDRKIKLTLEPLLEVAGVQIVMVIKRSNLPALDFDQIVNRFRETFDFNLKPETYGCATILDFLIKLDDFVQVHYTRTGPVVTIIETQLQELELRLWAMLLQSPHKTDLKNLKYNYRLRYENNLPSNKLPEIKSVEVSKSDGNIFISLTPFHTLAASLYYLLKKKDKPTKISDLVNMHFQKYDSHICPTDYGVKTVKELLLRMDFMVTICEENKNDYVILNKALSSYGVPIFKTADSGQIIWPSPPLHSLTRRPYYISPPKPDTPPLPGCWSDDLIFSPDSPDLYHNLQISLPLIDNKKRRNLTLPVFLSTPSPQAQKNNCFGNNFFSHFRLKTIAGILDNSGYGSNSSTQEVMFNAGTAYQFI